MKLLIYVPPPAALAHGSSVSGNVDYLVAPDLAWAITDRCLDTLAAKFALGASQHAAPGVHRLVCQAATDDAVLTALGKIQRQVNLAKSWARVRLLDGPGDVPDYVEGLWTKHPVSLYRDLLGPDVAQAMRLCLDVSPLC